MLGIRSFKNLREVERSVIGDLMDARKLNGEDVRAEKKKHLKPLHGVRKTYAPTKPQTFQVLTVQSY